MSRQETDQIINIVKQQENFIFVEQRLHPRFTVHYLTDVYQGDEIIFATVIDISGGGMGIVLPREFYPGEVLKLRVNCSLIDEADDIAHRINIYLRAKIMWINKEEKTYRAGLKISDIAQHDLIRLKRHIQHLQKMAFG